MISCGRGLKVIIIVCSFGRPPVSSTRITHFLLTPALLPNFPVVFVIYLLE